MGAQKTKRGDFIYVAGFSHTNDDSECCIKQDVQAGYYGVGNYRAANAAFSNYRE